MNGKRAKALRRTAEAGSTGYPRAQRTRVIAKFGNPLDPLDPPKYRIQLADRCTRSLYQTMKRAAQ